MKRLVQFFFIFSLAVLSACIMDFLDDKEKTDDGKKNDTYFPVATGSVWRYYEVEKDGLGNEIYSGFFIASITGTVIIDELEYIRIAIGSSDEMFYRFEDTTVYEYEKDSPIDIPVFDTLLASGEQTQFVVPMVESAEDTTWISATFKNLGLQKLQTPIGTFDKCMVFELYGYIGEVPMGRMTMWYARGIGLVKRVEENFENGVLVMTRTTTLDYYNISGGPSGGNSYTYSITGKVIEVDGAGVPGIQVKLMGSSEPHPVTITDANGTFSFKDQQMGFYWVGLYHHPHNWWFSHLSHEFELEDKNYTVPDFLGIPSMVDSVGIVVQGNVKNPDGLPVTDARVKMTRMFATWEVDTGIRGDYSFGNIVPGEGMVKVVLDGWTFEPDSVQVIFSAYPPQTVNFIGTGGSKITGRIITPSGNGLPGITMALQAPFTATNTETETVTDQNGYYTFRNLCDGTYMLIMRNHQFHVPGRGDLTNYGETYVVSGNDVTVNDAMVEPFTGGWKITGTIVNSRGQGLNNATLTLYDPEFLTTDTVPSFFGNFEFRGLYNSTYIITLDPSPYTGTNLTRTVTINNADANIAFNYTAFNVTGRARYDGKFIPGVTVTLDFHDHPKLTTTTDSNGGFTFTDIVNGHFWLALNKSGSFENVYHPFDVNGNTDVGIIEGNYVPPVEEN